MDQEDRALYEFFAGSLARRIGGAGAIVVRQFQPQLADQKKTEVVVQGDHGEIHIVFNAPVGTEESENFIMLLKEFDQIFPDLRIQEQPSRLQDRDDAVSYGITRADGGKGGLSCTFSGQFSRRELEGIRWYVLADETVTARLLFFNGSTGDRTSCLQLTTSGELYQMEFQGRAGNGQLLFRQRGVYRRDESCPGSSCYFAGTLRFSLSLLGDFLAGVTVSVELPQSIPALICEETVVTTRIAIEHDGRFVTDAEISGRPETFTGFCRIDKQIHPSVLRLTE